MVDSKWIPASDMVKILDTMESNVGSIGPVIIYDHVVKCIMNDNHTVFQYSGVDGFDGFKQCDNMYDMCSIINSWYDEYVS